MILHIFRVHHFLVRSILKCLMEMGIYTVKIGMCTANYIFRHAFSMLLSIWLLITQQSDVYKKVAKLHVDPPPSLRFAIR